jgi:putative redox protein
MSLKTIGVQGTLGAGFAIEVQCGNYLVVVDQPNHAAGLDSAPTPLELILATVAGCFDTIGRFLAHQRKIVLRGMRFDIKADYNPAGLLDRWV